MPPSSQRADARAKRRERRRTRRGSILSQRRVSARVMMPRARALWGTHWLRARRRQERAAARASRRASQTARKERDATRKRSLSATGVGSRGGCVMVPLARTLGYARAASAPSARARRRTSEPRYRRRANEPTRAPNDEKEEGRDEAEFSLSDGCGLA